jgi:hypothetical protein
LGCVSAARGEEASRIRLRQAAAEWGVDFRHHHGASGRRYMVETMVGGVVVFDFDGDGDEDLFFVDGGVLPGYQGEAPRSRLLRNEGGRFVDHTDRSGLRPREYGSGAVAGDYDDDGDLDVYVTALGSNSLWRNRGDGTFDDATAAAGVAAGGWSSGAAFADFDRDGDLDLYVARYVDFGLDNHKACNDEGTGLAGYCGPEMYEGVGDLYYRNLGDGRFADATREAGLDAARYAGLGVAVGDLDDDGWSDLYVANDLDPNLLYRNRGDGTFEDISLLSGTAYGEAGRPEAGMGIALGDVEGDGRLDVVVTNFELETNALYRNLGEGLFVDARFVANVAEASLQKLGFGVALADLDHDRDLDLVVANGHVQDNAAQLRAGGSFAQENQVYENDGAGRFRLVPRAGVEDLAVSRGLAVGDLDTDGDLDVVVLNTGGPAAAYENLLAAASTSWLQLDLVGGRSNSSAVGARVRLLTGSTSQLREVQTGGSYLSQSALTLHFGLGADAGPESRVEVSWPSGLRQSVALPAGTRTRLVEPWGPPDLGACAAPRAPYSRLARSSASAAAR